MVVGGGATAGLSRPWCSAAPAVASPSSTPAVAGERAGRPHAGLRLRAGSAHRTPPPAARRSWAGSTWSRAPSPRSRRAPHAGEGAGAGSPSTCRRPSLRACRVLVTTGLRDEVPDVPGVGSAGRDLLHRPYCHGCEVRDQPLGVLAGAPTAVQDSVARAPASGKWSDDVVLFTNGAASPPTSASSWSPAPSGSSTPVVSLVVEDDDRITGVEVAQARSSPGARPSSSVPGSSRTTVCSPTSAAPPTTPAGSGSTPPAPPASPACGRPATPSTRAPRSSPPRARDPPRRSPSTTTSSSRTSPRGRQLPPGASLSDAPPEFSHLRHRTPSQPPHPARAVSVVTPARPTPARPHCPTPPLPNPPLSSTLLEPTLRRTHVRPAAHRHVHRPAAPRRPPRPSTSWP